MRVAFALSALAFAGCVELTGGEKPEVASAADGGSAVESPEVVADPAPMFQLEKLAGGSVDLGELRGKIVVVDFWATWCAPCGFQVPELNAFYEEHRGDGDVEVFGISVDSKGPEAVADWAREYDVRYPVLLGSLELLGQYLRDGAAGIPYLVVIRRDGSIESSHAGLVERADLEAALARERG